MGEVSVMFKLIQAVVLGLVVVLLTGCEGMVKVGQNEDGSVEFSLVSSMTPCTTTAGKTDCSLTLPSIGNGAATGTDGAVKEPSTGTSVTQEPAYAGYVQWAPASFFEDGTAMSNNEVSHYEVVYGTSKTALNKTIKVAVSGLNTFELNQLPAGKWVVGIKTVSVYGTTSSVSNTVQVTI